MGHLEASARLKQKNAIKLPGNRGGQQPGSARQPSLRGDQGTQAPLRRVPAPCPKSWADAAESQDTQVATTRSSAGWDARLVAAKPAAQARQGACGLAAGSALPLKIARFAAQIPPGPGPGGDQILSCSPPYPPLVLSSLPLSPLLPPFFSSPFFSRPLLHSSPLRINLLSRAQSQLRRRGISPQAALKLHLGARPQSAVARQVKQVTQLTRHGTWPRGVAASTLDSESSDRGSNPREACGAGARPTCAWMTKPHLLFSGSRCFRCRRDLRRRLPATACTAAAHKTSSHAPCSGTSSGDSRPHSATGAQARVARVRAEYPSQLDYSGSGIFCVASYIQHCAALCH